jgi:hypothetical protein
LSQQITLVLITMEQQMIMEEDMMEAMEEMEVDVGRGVESQGDEGGASSSVVVTPPAPPQDGFDDFDSF